MTYFQQYNWYCHLANVCQRKFLFHEISFALIKENDNALLIAPLWINKSVYTGYRKGIYFFGREGWTDYCNFIYKEFREDVLAKLLEVCRNKYNLSFFRFDNLREDTSTYSYFKKNYSLMFDIPQKCVHLHLPTDTNSYLRMLSKNCRQNIRTAINRAKNDGIDFLVDFDDKQPKLYEFHKNRLNRLRKKKKTPLNFLGLKISIARILSQFKFHFPVYDPYFSDSNGKYITVTDKKNNNFAAGFYYGYVERRREICLMGVSLNENYNRFSPGIIALFHYIVSQINSKRIQCVDFTRGTEKYKYVLGGKEHYIHHIGFFMHKRYIL